MMNGKKLTPDEENQCWKKLDEEVLSLLDSGKHPSLKVPLSVTERKGEEEEVIELGSIEAQFYKLGEGKRGAWLVAFYNAMGDRHMGTFHLYQKVGDQLVRTAALEELKGPWDQRKILQSAIQIQPLVGIVAGGRFYFSSFHSPTLKGANRNRSQIVWEFDGSTLKPTLWVPEVDWHSMNGELVQGRGEVFEIVQ